MTDVTFYIKSLFESHKLSAKDSENLFREMLSGNLTEPQIAAVLAALATRGETVEEITGAVRAMRHKAVPIDAPHNVIDCCGTGGDQVGTYNISTAVAFVVAGCGVPVAKHGNRAASSKSGAADVLEALGLNLDAGAKNVHKALWENNICFLMAPVYNPAARHVAPVRKSLKARTIFNILGPLLNPAGAKRQLIGVYDKKWMQPMAETLKRLGTEKAYIVHGDDGLDEITLSTKTHVTALAGSEITQFEWHPSDIGLDTCRNEDLKGGDAQKNARALMDILKGTKGAYRDIVVFNAAAALMVADKAPDMKSAALLATESIDSGAAAEKCRRLIEIYNE